MQLNQKAKARREQGLFVAEGRKMFLEAPESWVSQVFVSETVSQDGELMSQAEKYPWGDREGFRIPSGCVIPRLPGDPDSSEAAFGARRRYLAKKSSGHGSGGSSGSGNAEPFSGPVRRRQAEFSSQKPAWISQIPGDPFYAWLHFYRMLFSICGRCVSLEKKLKEKESAVFAAHLKGENSYDQESYKGGTAFSSETRERA